MWIAGRTAKKVFKQPGAFALAVIKQFRANQGVLLAGAVAYYTLLSLVPLLILILMALSHIVPEDRLLEGVYGPGAQSAAIGVVGQLWKSVDIATVRHCRQSVDHDRGEPAASPAMSAVGPGRVKTQSVLWFPLLNRGGMMRGFVQGADREQTTLLPECLDDWVGENNPVRAVDVFVDALELRDLGFEGVDPAARERFSAILD